MGKTSTLHTLLNAGKVTRQLNELTQLNDQYEKYTESIEAQLKEAQQQIAQQNEQVQTLSTENSQLKEVNQFLSDQLAQTRTELSSARSELDSTRQELSNARPQIDTANAQIKSLNEQLSQTQADLDEANEELQHAAQILQLVEQLEAKHISYRNTIERLKSELSNARSALKSVQPHNPNVSNDELTTIDFNNTPELDNTPYRNDDQANDWQITGKSPANLQNNPSESDHSPRQNYCAVNPDNDTTSRRNHYLNNSEITAGTTLQATTDTSKSVVASYTDTSKKTTASLFSEEDLQDTPKDLPHDDNDTWLKPLPDML